MKPGQANSVHGGGSIWTTGSYDPVLKLLYWGVGSAMSDWKWYRP